jgi:beta-phosphoglucomutase family hydrolase
MPSFVTSGRFDAVLFDMDGVITDTARLHAQCWKSMFDDYLQLRAVRSGEPFLPFDLNSDYRLHVDGKPRYRGVRDFLQSRDVTLPEGSPVDSPEEETVCGLGNQKNALFNEALASTGVEAYPGSVAFLEYLRRMGLKSAVVTSSHNAHTVLEAANVEDYFDVQVDDEVLLRHKLTGKPSPDCFLKAAEMLGVTPDRAVVIEDALSGVQAGAKGGFGLVIGVARKGDAEELKAQGADQVVNDLAELIS